MDNNENKKDRGIFQGVALIIIGVVLICVKLFDFDIDWDILAKLWPLLLIIIGVCIMPINKWIRTAMVLLLLAFGAVMYHQIEEGELGVEKIEIRTRSHQKIIIDDDDFD